MPKIRINEHDMTGVIQKSPISNIIYIPILTEEAVPLVEKGKVVSICYSRKELENRIANKLVENDNSKVMYNIATRLIDLGFPVLVEGIVEGTSISKDLLTDKSLFDIRFLTSGIVNIEGVNEDIVWVAETRQDCIALIDVDESAAEFKYGSIRAAFEKHASVYAAGFTPWFYSEHPTLLKGLKTLTDSVAIPAAYGYLFAYGRMLANNAAEWQAVAGPERGIIPELSDVFYTYSYADVEVLQARAENNAVELDDATDNVGVAINPIAWVRPNGYILYGNRTLKDNDSKKKTTAQSFLNVRNGVNAIKKVMYDAGRIFVFEQNTEILWTNFKNYITPLLDRMQNSDGLLGYTFVKVATDAKARLKAKLTVIPVEAVEDFDLDIYLVDDLTVTEE